MAELREAATRVRDVESDGKREYARAIVWRGLNDLVRRKAVKRNDGLAMTRHWRFDMVEFHCKKHPKYMLLGNHFLTAVNGGASERVRHQMTWNRTVSVKGGKEGSIAMDLYNEFLNGYFKGMHESYAFPFVCLQFQYYQDPVLCRLAHFASRAMPSSIYLLRS